MPSLVSRNASILLWGHTENDVTYSDQTLKEMMSLFLHSAKLACPLCLLGFAYTMRFGSFPGDNHNFNMQWPVVLEDIVAEDGDSGISRQVFYANLGDYIRNFTRAQYAEDGTHISEQNHDILGGLLMDAAKVILDGSINDGDPQKKNLTQPAPMQPPKQYDYGGQFHHLFRQSTSIQSICVDEPTLNVDEDRFSYVIDGSLKRDSKRHDFVRYIVPKFCPQTSLFTFPKEHDTDFLIGLGLFGNYSFNVSGQPISTVKRPEAWQTCANTRDWPLWWYYRWNGTQVDVEICSKDNSTKLRYLSLLELPRNATSL